MNSTWRSVILALAVALAAAAVILLVIFLWVLPAPFEEAQEPEYVIGDWQGQVAVFEGRQAYPMQVLDVYTGTLPAPQQRQVLAGVPVTDGETLWQVLEDYTG